MDNQEFWRAIRQALLMAVDAIERFIGISPTTSDIRKTYKKGDQVQRLAKIMTDLDIIENTKDGEKNYTFGFGSTYSVITEDQIESLKSGKCIAFYDGEYSHFIIYEPFKRKDWDL